MIPMTEGYECGRVTDPLDQHLSLRLPFAKSIARVAGFGRDFIVFRFNINGNELSVELRFQNAPQLALIDSHATLADFISGQSSFGHDEFLPLFPISG